MNRLSPTKLNVSLIDRTVEQASAFAREGGGL